MKVRVRLGSRKVIKIRVSVLKLFSAVHANIEAETGLYQDYWSVSPGPIWASMLFLWSARILQWLHEFSLIVTGEWRMRLKVEPPKP